MSGELDKDTIARAYARWAPIYDVVFGAVFEPGRRASIDAAERIGGRILDVGVGTGISLSDYSRDVRLFGVDYSEAMLRKARHRVEELKLANVETLAVLPWIVQNGAAAYAAIGTEKSKGTKLFSVSGHVAKPGVYEVDLGYPLLDFINNEAGGVSNGRKLKAVIPGGSSVPVMTAAECEGVLLDYESLLKAGSMLGSGGMIVLDETTSMPETLSVIADFYAHESCGQCTPCREGTGWAAKILKNIIAGEGKRSDVDLL